MAKDLVKYLLLKNIMFYLALMLYGKPWHGAREKSNIFFQLHNNAYFSFGNIVVYLTANTKASMQAW